MKISRLIVLGLYGLALIVCLAGCKIISASPDPNQVIEMRPGDKILFKVMGPVNTPTSRCVWHISNKSTWEEVSRGKNEFELNFNDDSWLSNKKNIITCEYQSYQLEMYCDEITCFNFRWRWKTVNSISWEVRTNPNSSTVMTGDYIIENESDLQLLNGYTTVTGSLTIGPDIQSLEALESLTTIGRELGILQNNYIKNLTALENLTSIGGFSIYSNDALTSLDGLGNITSISGDLWIKENDALTNLSGLENLASIGKHMYIENNKAITSLSGLGNLASVGKDMYILNNAALTSLSGLENLSSVGGGLEIWKNPVLTSLSGLENLTLIGGFLYIINNDALTTLGMTGLQKVLGNFDIINNPLLCKSLAIDLRNQVLLRKGIWGIITISGNKDCTAS
jgi:hypothetical protein